jgi:hypothetical protein
LRWFSQRILPYPTFLTDENHSAHLLGITVESFLEIEKSGYLNQLNGRYKGPLQEFIGARWWRAALQWALEVIDVDPWSSPRKKAEALTSASGIRLDPLKVDDPVVVYDGQSKVVSIDTDISRAVRIQADGWPVFADDPWSSLPLVVADPRLRQLVALGDVQKVADFVDAAATATAPR